MQRPPCIQSAVDSPACPTEESYTDTRQRITQASPTQQPTSPNVNSQTIILSSPEPSPRLAECPSASATHLETSPDESARMPRGAPLLIQSGAAKNMNSTQQGSPVSLNETDFSESENASTSQAGSPSSSPIRSILKKSSSLTFDNAGASMFTERDRVTKRGHEADLGRARSEKTKKSVSFAEHVDYLLSPPYLSQESGLAAAECGAIIARKLAGREFASKNRRTFAKSHGGGNKTANPSLSCRTTRKTHDSLKNGSSEGILDSHDRRRKSKSPRSNEVDSKRSGWSEG